MRIVKTYLSDTLKVNYEAICANFQEIGKRLDEAYDEYREEYNNIILDKILSMMKEQIR